MEHVLSLGPSVVNVNTRGGFFNWTRAGRSVMPLIDVPNSSKQRSSHTCFPVFGLPKDLIPGATKLMDRHGPFRSSELRVVAANEKSIGLELANRPDKQDPNLFAQYPRHFVVQQRLELLTETTLHFTAEHYNLSEETSRSSLALHSYFNYTGEGVTLAGLAGCPYQVTRDAVKLGDAVLTNPLISGPLADRDWKFPANRLPDPLSICFPGESKITMKVAGSHPAVNNWMVWMDPTQCAPEKAFICVEPMIEGIILESGDCAALDVLISVE